MGAIAHSVSYPRSKRQYRTVEERRRIVEETMVPGASVARVARAHGVNANQVFAWRKLYQSGLLESQNATSAGTSGVRLLPVAVSTEMERAPAQTAFMASRQVADRHASAGSIELTLAQAQIRITGQVDTGALLMILESLRG